MLGLTLIETKDLVEVTPVPLRLTFWGLAPPLLETVNVPVLVPAAVGLNVTLIRQLVPAATLLPQPLLGIKSAVLVPAIATLVMLKLTLPTLFRVTVCGALLLPTPVDGNVRLFTDSFTMVPVPLRLTTCGLPLALSVIVTCPGLAPIAVGVNLTLIVHCAATARLLPHVVVLL